MRLNVKYCTFLSSHYFGIPLYQFIFDSFTSGLIQTKELRSSGVPTQHRSTSVRWLVNPRLSLDHSKYALKNTTYKRIQSGYRIIRQKYFTDNRAFIKAGLLKDLESSKSDCQPCHQIDLCLEHTQCYADCTSKSGQLPSETSVLLGETIQKPFCVPLGFQFQEAVLSSDPMWISCKKFLDAFNDQKTHFLSSLWWICILLRIFCALKCRRWITHIWGVNWRSLSRRLIRRIPLSFISNPKEVQKASGKMR